MKKLMISFLDTDETIVLYEESQIVAWMNREDGYVRAISLEVNSDLPNILLKKPIMFYVYEDVPILKLYRSVYIDRMEWLDC